MKNFPTIFCAALVWLGCMMPASGRSADTGEATLGLVPQPARAELRQGQWTLKSTARIVAQENATTEATKLAAAVSIPLGRKLQVVREPPRHGDIEMVLVPSATQFGHEGYCLTVTSNGVAIRAATAAGLFYGGITFRQLLPAEAFSTSRSERALGDWTIRCLEIDDHPRFPWRGLLLDPARHFLPPEFTMMFVDAMALHKLNSLQLHLTDDQGWRLEITKYPRLTKIGSVRKESPRRGDRNQGDGQPYGPFFYTRSQIRDLVAYAEARHVTLVPEIEIPGHFQAALAAYPEFSCTGGPFEVRTRWGVEPDILCAGNDAAVTFAKDVLAEVCELFPSRFIHIGGDEAPRDRWKACPKCQARMKVEGLKTEAQLQTWLNRQLEEFLASKGRRMIGWDEILEGGLTPNAVVMSWRGIEGGVAAAQAGHDVVMSPTTHCYFDYAQAKESTEPECIGGFIPLEKVYAFDPIPSGVPFEKQRHILGAQGNIWAEFLWTPQDVDYFAFPRATALAEVMWSPAGVDTFDGFERRFRVHARRLDELGVNYRKALLKNK